MPTTSIGEILAQIVVKPTTSLNNTVTLSKCCKEISGKAVSNVGIILIVIIGDNGIICIIRYKENFGKMLVSLGIVGTINQHIE